MKLTKKDLASLPAFNKLRKSIGEKPMTEGEYTKYLYGRVEKIKPKPKSLNPISIPNWAIDHSSIKSVTTDHVATKPNDLYKKEISRKYTISISYNKGSYAVIPQSEIQCIGRK